MAHVQYQALGPLLSGEGSRAFLGLEIFEGEARPIVLVWVPEEVADTPALRQELLRETQRAVRLDHPNIVRVHGLARMEEGLARVVEYADGEPLRLLLSRRLDMPAPIAARVVADAALGVHHAHSVRHEDGSPWVHGDLRPETLIISYGGLTKVSGYGALTLAPRDFQSMRARGRHHHCAPEQVLGGREVCTPQTDVYLLGLVLYECITGTIPFAGAENFEEAVLRQELPLLHSGAIPERLVPILARATAKKAAVRHPTPLHLREELERAMGPLPTQHELSRWVAEAMQGDTSRPARQREIDAGIADFAQKQWQRRGERPYSDEITNAGVLETADADAVKRLRRQVAEAEAARAAQAAAAPPPPRPAAPPARPPVPPARPSGPALQADGPLQALPRLKVPPAAPAGVEVTPAPLPPRPPPARPSAGEVTEPLVRRAPPIQPTPTPAPQAAPAGRTMLWVGVGALVLAVLLTAVNLLRPQPVAAPAPAAAPAALPPTAAAAPPAPSSPAPVAALPTPPAAGADELVAPLQAEKPAAAPRPPPPPPQLALTVVPAVHVAINGKSVGRSPVTVALKPGRHRVSLVDRQLGIHVTRTVSVGRSGTTTEVVELGKGSVSVNAPPNASVFFDGRLEGKAPLKQDAELWEGHHEILVTFDGAKWKQKFQLRAGEHLNFNVEVDYVPTSTPNP